MKSFNTIYFDLKSKCDKLGHYYDIDKIKPLAVYVWTKGENGLNVFDILEDKIIFYDESHVISNEIKPIIEEIQQELKNVRMYIEGRINDV